MIDKAEQRTLALKDVHRRMYGQPGSKLQCAGMPVTATIIAQSTVKEEDYGYTIIVLAVREGSFQPYVTWKRMLGVDERADGNHGAVDYCIHGHYFHSLDQATNDYIDRVQPFAAVKGVMASL